MDPAVSSPPEISLGLLDPPQDTNSEWIVHTPRCLEYDGVKIPINCPGGEIDLSHPHCRLDHRWFVDRGRVLTRDAINSIKRRAAATVLRHKVVLTPDSLTLRILREPSAWPGFRPVLESDPQKRRQEDLDVALRSMRLVQSIHPRLIALRNPLFTELTADGEPPQLKAFVAAARADGFTVIDMEDNLPIPADRQLCRSWYNLPVDAHWSDKGATIYGKRVAALMRSVLIEWIRKE
jgi:hypothetical protein